MVAKQPKLKIIDKVDNDPGLKQKQKKNNVFRNPNSGAVYVSHLPHGFYEYQLRNFFKQFGTVLRVSVPRSEKTGEARGFGYVHYISGEVAEIATETMDGYLMRGKILQCQYIPFEKIVHRKMFPPVTTATTCSTVLRRKDAIIALNRPRNGVKKRENIKKQYASKLQRLQKAGIKFDIDLIVKSEPKVESKKEEVKTEVNGNDLKEKENKPKKLKAKKKKNAVNAAQKENKEVTDTVVEGEDSAGATEAMQEESEIAELKKFIQEGTPGTKKRKVKDSEELEEIKVVKVGKKGNKKKKTQGESKLVVEVDASDDEIQFKTPPNMVKKFVRITPSSPACKPVGETDSPNISNGSQTKETTDLPLMKTLFKQKKKVPVTPKVEREVETPPTVKLTPGLKNIKKAKSPGTPVIPKPVLKEVEAETPQTVTSSVKKAKKVKTPSTSVTDKPETPPTVKITPGIKKAKKTKTPGTPGQKIEQNEEKVPEIETPQTAKKTPGIKKVKTPKTPLTVKADHSLTPLKRKQSDDDLKAKTLFKKLKAATLEADDVPSDSPKQTPKKGKTPIKKDKEESNLQVAENSETPNEVKTPKTPKVNQTPKTPKVNQTPKTPKVKKTPKAKSSPSPATPKLKKTPKAKTSPSPATPKVKKTPKAKTSPSAATLKVKKFGKTKKFQSVTPAPQKKKTKILKAPKSV